MDFYCDLIEWSRNNSESICGRIYKWLEEKYREILKNAGSLTCYDPDFGELTWPLEEGSFLKVIKDYDEFYEEIKPFVSTYIDDEELEYDIFRYQKAVVKNPWKTMIKLELRHDLYKYFYTIYSGGHIAIEKKPNKIILDSSEVSHDLVKYARDTVWFGRKGGQNIITKIKYED